MTLINIRELCNQPSGSCSNKVRKENISLCCADQSVRPDGSALATNGLGEYLSDTLLGWMNTGAELNLGQVASFPEWAHVIRRGRLPILFILVFLRRIKSPAILNAQECWRVSRLRYCHHVSGLVVCSLSGSNYN